MADLRFKIHQQLTEDQAILLSTFPEEVWQMILPKCNTESCLALSNTSTCFKHLLLPGRTAYLFPQVWSVVEDTYVKIQEQILKEERRIIGMEMEQQRLEYRRARAEGRQFAIPPIPSLMKWIFTDPLTRGHRSTLMLRQVCKDWRDTIDSSNLKGLFEAKTNPRRRLKNHNAQNWISLQETKLLFEFNFNRFEQSVLKQSSDKVSNFVRAIVITIWSADVFNLLKRMGNLVWYCTIKTYYGSHIEDVAYINVMDILKLLPNLKTLEVEDCNVSGGRNSDPGFENQLLKIVSENPIRKLEKLQVLVTKNLPFPIFNELVKSHSHIKTLYVDRTSSCGQYDICTSPLFNLQELSFQICSEADMEVFWQPCVCTQGARLHLSVATRNALNWNQLIQLFQEKLGDNLITLRVFESKWEGLGKEVAEDLQRLNAMQKLLASLGLLPL